MQPIPAGYPIEELSGPLIVACLLHWGLFGTLSVQLYLYYLAFPNDRQSTKCLVYVIYTIEFVQTLLVAHDEFETFGNGFGDIKSLIGISFSWLTVPIMSAVVACVGQFFYAYRIFILSKSRTIPVFVTCVSLTSSVAGIVTGVYCLQAGDITKLNNRKTSISVGIWLGASALCDIIIAVCMTYYLMRSNTGFHRTRLLATKLIRLTIETGTVTAVVALLCLILFFALPHQTFYVPSALIIPKLQANTVLMVLNSRIRILGGRNTYLSSTAMVRDITCQSTGGTKPTDRMQSHAVVVTVSKQVFNDDLEMDRVKGKPQDDSVILTA